MTLNCLNSPSFLYIIMEKSFPPVDALVSHLKGIDYIKWLNIYMDAVEELCIILAAIAVVLYQKVSSWYHNGGKDSLIELHQKMHDVLDLIVIGWHQVQDFIESKAWESWHGEINVGPLCVGYDLQNRWDDLEVCYIGWSDNFFTYWSRIHGFVTVKSLEI